MSFGADHLDMSAESFHPGDRVVVDTGQPGTVVALGVVPGLVRVHLSTGGPGLLDLDVEPTRLRPMSHN